MTDAKLLSLSDGLVVGVACASAPVVGLLAFNEYNKIKQKRMKSKIKKLEEEYYGMLEKEKSQNSDLEV